MLPAVIPDFRTKIGSNNMVNRAGRVGRLLIRQIIDEKNPNLEITAVVGANTDKVKTSEENGDRYSGRDKRETCHGQ